MDFSLTRAYLLDLWDKRNRQLAGASFMERRCDSSKSLSDQARERLWNTLDPTCRRGRETGTGQATKVVLLKRRPSPGRLPISSAGKLGSAKKLAATDPRINDDENLGTDQEKGGQGFSQWGTVLY